MTPTENPTDSLLPRPGTDFPLALGPYLKDVGRGARKARSLSREEAADAAGIILDGRASEAQIGAFFQAMRIKSETPEELAGIVDAILDRCGLAARGTHSHRIELGLAYDGRLRGFHVMPFAARVAARFGIQTFFPGTRALGPKFGINAIEILEATGLPRAADLDSAIEQLEEGGIGACDQSAYCPKLAALQTLRNEVFLRGPFATAEKLLNLSAASAVVTSVVHRPYIAPISGAIALLLNGGPGTMSDRGPGEGPNEGPSEGQGTAGWVIQAPEGHLDIPPGRKTSAWRVPDRPDEKPSDAPREIILGAPAERATPDRAETKPPNPPKIDPLQRTERIEWIEANVAWGEDVLAGREEKGCAALISSAALLIWLGDKATTYEDGLAMAEKALAEGKG